MSPFLADAGTTVLSHLGRATLTGGLFMALVALLIRAVPRLPAGVRCALWWLACLKLLIGLVWVEPLRLPLLPEAWSPAAAVSAPARSEAGVPPARSNVSGPSVLILPSASSVELAPAWVSPGSHTLAEGAKPATSSWRLGLLVLWLTGLLLELGLLGWGLWRSGRVIRRAAPASEASLLGLFGRLVNRLGLRREPGLRLSAEVRTPQALGSLRPQILLPLRRLGALTPDEVEMTLCHELVHVRRGDLWLAWVPALAQRLFFFFPPAAWAAREYLVAREAACDAEVLRVLGSAPQAYGRLLLQWGVAPRETGLAAAGASPTLVNLKRRLQMLHETTETSRRSRLRWGLAGAVALVALIPFTIVAQPPAPEPPEAPAFAEAPEAAMAPDAEEPPAPGEPAPAPVPAEGAWEVEAAEPGEPVPAAEAAPALAGAPAPEAADAVQPEDAGAPEAYPTPRPAPLPGTPAPPRVARAPRAVPALAPAAPLAAPVAVPPAPPGAGRLTPRAPVAVAIAPPARAPRTPAPMAIAPAPRVAPVAAPPVPAIAPPPPGSAHAPRPSGTPAPAAWTPRPAAAPRAVIAGRPGHPGQPAMYLAAGQPAPPRPPAAPPAPPAPPRGKSSSNHNYTINYGDRDGDSWVYISGENTSMSGSRTDLAEARRVRGSGGDVLWFKRGGKAYVVRDAATLARIEALWKPVGELGEQQGKLGAEQGKLGAQQGALGAKQGALGAQMGAVGSRQARSGDDGSVEREMEELGRKIEDLGRQQEALGRQQEELGRQQEALGRQQEEVSRKAEAELDRLIEAALRNGSAQTVR